MGLFDFLRGKQKPASTPAPVVPFAPPDPAQAAREAEQERHWAAVRTALDAPLVRTYGAQSPFTYGAMIAWEDGGPDPLASVAVYWNERGPHFHYVSYGMSEIHDKVSPNKARSGWGFELTFRLRADPALKGTDPARFMDAIAYNAPTWPISLLNALGRSVHASRRPFAHDHWIEGRSAFDAAGTIRHLALCRDAELGEVVTPNGQVTWLQVVAITDDELAEYKRADAEHTVCPVLARRQSTDPLLVTEARVP